MIQGPQRGRMAFGESGIVKRRRGDTTDKCAECGVTKPSFAMRTQRIPGVGTMHYCRGKHAA